jgi:hypothetical protein
MKVAVDERRLLKAVEHVEWIGVTRGSPLPESLRPSREGNDQTPSHRWRYLRQLISDRLNFRRLATGETTDLTASIKTKDTNSERTCVVASRIVEIIDSQEEIPTTVRCLGDSTGTYKRESVREISERRRRR